ncbi:MAG: hypothetical protein HY754_02955 [Nitrospirae bacterium]|nr:hypothetical protein [Nitrospirota bacterium]
MWIIFNIGGVPINYYTGFEIPILRDNALQCMKKELEEKGKGSVRIWLIVSDLVLKKEGEDSVKWMNEHYSLVTEKGYLRDPDYEKKTRLFKTDFMEYRIKIYLFAHE